MEISDSKARFSEAVWFQELSKTPVVVLGVGGIGSWVTFALARIGYPIYVFDMDRVEMVNLAGQLYGMNSIGDDKVEAIENICDFLCDEVNIEVFAEEYTDESMTGPVVIAAFDNMKARKLAYGKWKDIYGGKDGSVFIDGRLLAEDYQIYTVNSPERCAMYEKTLFNDNEVGDAPCSLKSTTHCSMGIASDVVSVLTNHIANLVTKEKFGTEVRDVPFSIIKSIPLFSYEVSLGEESQHGHAQELGAVEGSQKKHEYQLSI